MEAKRKDESMKKMIAAVPLALILAGCTVHVEDKFHIPEFKRPHIQCEDPNNCENGTKIDVKVPECYRLTLFNWSGWDSDICVTKEIWEKTQVGQVWTDETYNI